MAYMTGLCIEILTLEGRPDLMQFVADDGMDCVTSYVREEDLVRLRDAINVALVGAQVVLGGFGKIKEPE